MKRLEDYLKLPYKIEITKNEDSTFFVSIKELPGCMTEADTIEEAHLMIEDAKKVWIEAAISDGFDIPEPEAYQEKEYSGKLVLRIPKSMHRKLAIGAGENDISLNQYLNVLLSERNSILKEKNRTIDFLAQKLFEKDQKSWSISDRFEIPEDECDDRAPYLVEEN